MSLVLVVVFLYYNSNINKYQLRLAMSIYHIPSYFTKGPLKPVSTYVYTASTASKKKSICFEQHLICLLLDGQKEIFTPSDIVRFNQQHFCLVQAGNTLMTERLSFGQNYRSLLLFFSNEFLHEFIQQYQLELPTPNLTAQKLCLLGKDSYIQHFEASLLMLDEQREKGRRTNTPTALYRAKLEELLLYLLERDAAPILAFLAQCLAQQAHASFRQVVQQHLDQPLRSNELAFLCNMSISTFKRRFQEVFQTSPQRYFIQYKMEKAARLLQHQKRPSEIYEDLGYESLAAFSHAFKKHFGQTPSNYHLVIAK